MSFEDSQRGIAGAWQMMTGRPDGVRLLDLSADGFWNSFFAIVLAAPALLPGWVAFADQMLPEPELGARLSVLLRSALVDLGTWILPLVLLALAAGRAGIGDRFVAYVVATNWASVIFAWVMLPVMLLAFFVPDAMDLVASVSLVLFFVINVLTWRLTNAAIGKGAAVATAVFAGMLAASLVVLFALEALLGLQPPGA